MAKRSAATELTDRNWDQEEEPEDAGQFTKANEATLKGRQIIKAKRRNVGDATDGKSAFSAFGGFSFKPTQTSTPLFSGGFFKTEAKTPASEKRKEVSETEKEESESPTKRQKADTNGNKQTDSNGCSPDRTAYLSNLKALNVSVVNWISQHIEKNPYCILTPIFKDYETHLEQIEKDKRKAESNGNASAEVKKEESVKTMEVEKPYAPQTGLTFGLGNLDTKSQSSVGFPGFSFKPSASGATGTGFSLGSSSGASSGFSFAVGTSKAPDSQGGADKGDEEEYVPPVAETVEHKEEGSLYSKKCKLFYQKEGAWTEKGVGFLHLKKNDDIAQLLVRADTSLGNILLNVRLSESMPLSRQGKNNVSIMCVINPAIPDVPNDKPIPMLIRVKTAEDADELLEKMKEVRS